MTVVIPQAPVRRGAAINDLSGIVLNQNEVSAGVTTLPFPHTYYQTFTLPDDYARGENSPAVPDITGFQILVDVTAASTASINWTFDHLNDGSWETLDSGVTVSCGYGGLVWINIYSRPIAIDPTWLADNFRLGIIGSQDIASVTYSVPNPLTTGQAFDADGTTPITDTSRSVSLMFRVLAATADSGTDFLGDVYRSIVAKSSVSNVSSDSKGALWLSKPNPSYFGVESIYFDERVDDQGVVIDRVTIDPTTPGVYFHIYYSNDPTGPGVDAPSWENLLWTPVYKTFQALRTETHALPEPIVAKYVKIEFTMLQARAYDPGGFQLPITFKKHPKWVLDYFLARFAVQERDFVSSGVDITYDALDLAFSYYKGDILQNPDPPPLSLPPTQQQIQFFRQEDAANTVDTTTLGLIRIAFQPYLSQPAQLGRFTSILGAYALGSNTGVNYPTEIIQTAIADTSIVSNLQREPLVVEKSFPVMFFFVPCRHGYRVSQSLFEKNRAYFAGINEIAFHRDSYSLSSNQTQYNEPFGDGVNTLLNEFTE